MYNILTYSVFKLYTRIQTRSTISQKKKEKKFLFTNK